MEILYIQSPYLYRPYLHYFLAYSTLNNTCNQENKHFDKTCHVIMKLCKLIT